MWRFGATGPSNDVYTCDDDLRDCAVRHGGCAVCCDLSGLGKIRLQRQGSMDPVIIIAALIIIAVEMYIRLL